MALCRGKVGPDDAFVVTAYLTDQLKVGASIWPKKVKVWFDSEGEFLEVQFKDAHGFMRHTDHEAVMERVDEEGHILGFSVICVSRFQKDHPLEAELVMDT